MTELKINYHLLQKKGTESLEAILENILQQGETELRVVSVFITSGFEFSQMKKRVLKYKKRFKKVCISKPVLKGRRRINSFAAFLINEYKMDKNSSYVFVGHGLPDSKNREYFKLEKALKKQGFDNAKVFLLKGKSGDFSGLPVDRKITVIPLLISCGKHIQQDIFGSEDSFYADLESRGFSVEKKIVSLDMSENFKKEFLK